MIGYRRLRLVLPVAALGAVAASAAGAQEGSLMRDTLSTLGLVEKDQAPIVYRERAPLVMPPKLDGKSLPAPRTNTAASQPAWPKEPEVLMREREQAERRNPRGNQVSGRYNDNNATVSVEEIRGGRRADAQLPAGGERRPGDNSREGTWLNPLEMMMGKKEEVAEPSDVEPTRDSLVQPPSGYRKAPRKVARTGGDPLVNPAREREEADPGAYQREQLRR